MTGLQWLASETWATYTVLQTPHFMPYLRGTLGIAIRRGEIPGLKDFLLKIHPDNDPDNSHENSIVSILVNLILNWFVYLCLSLNCVSSGQAVLGAHISV